MDVAVPGTPEIAVMRDFRLQSAHPLTTVLRYRVVSYPSAIMDPVLPRWMRKRETALPEDDNPRVVAFARTLHATAGDERDLIARVLGIIRDGPYVYTLEPTPLSSRNSVDQFWFDTRRGFCAHYAGAFVYLMRAAGIPARMVGGYLGGEVNPITGHVVVRQYDAHAWAEVWLDGAGWVRVDPTAAVAPARIESGLMDALSEEDRASLSLFASARLGAAWFSDALYFFESIDHRWNLWVVGYDASVQSQFLGDLLGDVTPATTGLALLAGGAVSLGLVVGTLFWRRRREVLHPGMSAFKRFSNGIARQGVVRRMDETPSMFVRRLGAERGLAAIQVESLVEQLESVLYNPAADQSPRSIRRLKRGLRRFSMASALRTAG
jgi:transglutaminase-like putative cysteine protease